MDSPRPSPAARESMWTVSLVEVAGEDLPLSAAKLGAHAHRLGLPPPHTGLPQQAPVPLGRKGHTGSPGTDEALADAFLAFLLRKVMGKRGVRTENY